MRVYYRREEVPRGVARAVTIGTFDGVHLGHQELLRHLCTRASALGIRSCVLTFEPHPQLVLGKRPLPGVLTPLPEKLQHLQRAGVEEVFVVHFSQEFSRLSPEEFAQEYLQHTLQPQLIVVGYDHMFGHERRGNAALLRQMGFAVEELPPVLLEGEPVSSSRIRRLLQEGNVTAARRLLGYPYTVCGIVVRGDGRGRRLGFPTANLQPSHREKLLPAYGIYVASTTVQGIPRFGLLSYGVRPTFGATTPQLELYLLDFEGSLYNERLCVSFWERVRAEERFPTVEHLIAQMRRDEAFCRVWLAQHKAEVESLTSAFVGDAEQGTQG